MLISCTDENPLNNDTDSKVALVDKFYSCGVNIYSEESVSLCEIINLINIDLPFVKFVYNYNPFFIARFSGSMRDFIYYLDKAVNVHCDFEFVNDLMIVTFSECNIHKYYQIRRIDCSMDELVAIISKNIPNTSKLDNGLFISTNCKNHEIVNRIITEYDAHSDLSMHVEFVILEIHTNDNYNSNFIDIIESAMSGIEEDWGTKSITSIIHSVSSFLESNKSGKCQVDSHLNFVLHNGGTAEISNGLDRSKTEYYINKRGKILSEMSGQDKNKSYLKINVSGFCNQEHGTIKFKIDSKSDLGNSAGVSTSAVSRRFKNNETIILSQRKITGESNEDYLFSRENKYEVNTVMMVNIKIIQGEGNEK